MAPVGIYAFDVLLTRKKGGKNFFFFFFSTNVDENEWGGNALCKRWEMLIFNMT